MLHGQLRLVTKNMDLNNSGAISLTGFVTALADPNNPEEQVELPSADRPTRDQLKAKVDDMSLEEKREQFKVAHPGQEHLAERLDEKTLHDYVVMSLLNASAPGSGPTPVYVEGMEGAAAEYSPPPLSEEMLIGMVCKVASVKKYTLLWNSYGTMAQKQGSTWHGTSNPLGDGAGIAFRNKFRINIGHYAADNFEEPSMACTTLELIDSHKSKLQSSDRLEHVAEGFFPCPVRYHNRVHLLNTKATFLRYHFVWSQLQVC